MGSLPMENTLLIGLSRQIALQRELDVVANNVANMNTTGYKADGAIFEEYLMPTAQAAELPGRRPRVSYVQDRATWRDFGSGPIRPTGNPLDVAIDGDAFFVVQTPRGERYTRNGAFQINAQGELVTTTGDRVVGDGGPIQFPATDNSISINPDGHHHGARRRQFAHDSARGKLRLVRFDSVQQLQKDGTTLFNAPAGRGAAGGGDELTGEARRDRAIERACGGRDGAHDRGDANLHAGHAMMQQFSDLRRSAVEKLAEVPAYPERQSPCARSTPQPPE
jgi:flagellar basal body rod protein FlgG